MKHLINDLFLLISLLITVEAAAQTPSVTLGDVKVNDLGMSKLLYRAGQYGLMIEDVGLCFEMSLPYTAKNLGGDRLICYVTVDDSNGNHLSDRSGECTSIAAETLASNNDNGTFRFVMPQGWLVNSISRESRTIRLSATVLAINNEEVSVAKDFALGETDMKIDNKNLPNKLMGDIFSSSSGDMVSDMLGALFGGTTASSTEPCPSCDGERICQHCDGDGFFNPSLCRKCTAAPGVCRRCKGSGEVTLKVDIY